MKAFIQSVDLTKDGKVIVTGNLPSTNLEVKLVEHIYITEPEDGIWGYTLEVLPTALFGAQILIPFIVESPWTGDKEANGLRIVQPSVNPSDSDYETVLLKIKKVEKFTEKQNNRIILEGAFFDKITSHLIIDLIYSGGCFPHIFSLEWDGLLRKSNPPQYNLNVVDLSDYDPCRALIHAQLRVDVETQDFQLQNVSSLNLLNPSGGRQLKVEVK